jgi:hypothetical protein
MKNPENRAELNCDAEGNTLIMTNQNGIYRGVFYTPSERLALIEALQKCETLQPGETIEIPFQDRT